MYTRQYFLIWSANRQTGSLTDYTIKVSPAITNDINAEWISCSVPGLTLQIEELTTLSRNSNGVYYWRFINDLMHTPTRYDDPARPFTLNQLTIHWRNPDGIAPLNLPEHTIELELWCEVEEA